MSKFASGVDVVRVDSDSIAEKFTLKEKLSSDKWTAENEKGLLTVLDQKNIFKINYGKIKIGDYAYNAISSSVTLINEDDDLIYANDNYYKVQNYKENKHESHNT
jgi:predicted mannosyl-3-phosphoglycerate phosphatase (HAD superfamily)